MRKPFILLILFCVLFGCTTIGEEQVVEHSPDIFVNQVGYLPEEEKYFISEAYTGTFQIIRVGEDDNDPVEEPVFSGEVLPWQSADASTGMDLSMGDFSELTQEGRYYVLLDDGSSSYSFNIGLQVFNEARDMAIKSFYYQRSGMELLEEHAGIFARPAGHNSPMEFHHEAAVSGTMDVSGGWYDAGDYGRYIAPASLVYGVMMLSYEQFPERYSSDALNIPESGNGIPDFLDEIRYELEWMLKMQYTGGGEFHGALPWMVNEKGYSWGMPHEAVQPMYIHDFTTVTTADFAAVMANAARNFQEWDAEFSTRCLEAALLAWDYLERTPEVYPAGGFRNPEDTLAGGYGLYGADNSSEYDDRTWAALELYFTTADPQFHEYALPGLERILRDPWEFSWMSMGSLVRLQYALAQEPMVDMELQQKHRDKMLAHSDRLVRISDGDGFKTVLEPQGYYWGSNGHILNHALILIMAYELSGDDQYRDTALCQLNYILGLNALNFSHVVGLGTVYPQNMHSAITINDDVEGVFPGLMSGGANRNLDNDYTLPEYFNSETPPALCYIDHQDSWSTNEPCIGYNAPLVAVSAYFSHDTMNNQESSHE